MSALFGRFGLIAAGALFLLAMFDLFTEGDRLAVPDAPELRIAPVAFSDLEGWNTDRLGETIAVFRRSCDTLMRRAADQTIAPRISEERSQLIDLMGTPQDWEPVCTAATALGDDPTDADARAFYETNFSEFSSGFGFLLEKRSLGTSICH